MKSDAVRFFAAAALGALWLLSAGQTAHAARNYNLSIDSNNAERCADLKVTSRDGEVAQVNDSVTLGPRELSTLEIEDGAGRAMVRVRAWDRPDYQVETCKMAVAENRAAAETLARGINVSRSAGRLTTTGPSTNDGSWQVYFLVRAPKNANLDLQTKNGPIHVEGIAGNVKVRATNGPLALKNCGGTIDAHTTNGPISFSGNSGDVKLTAQNGPVALELTGESWTGPQLDARTVNGPVSISVPENYRSGVRLQTSGHSPLSCNIGACRTAVSDLSNSSTRTIQLNGAGETVRVQTSNGPVSVRAARGRVI
jgi:hypothetical protein